MKPRTLDYQKAIQLRMLGKSYNEIAKDLDVGKSLLSYWLKDLELSPEAKTILDGKSNYAKEKFQDYNRQKHQRVQKENQEIKKKFTKKVGKISNREMLLLGAALYWAEGYKRHGGKHPSPHISFSNSDPKMIKFFLQFVRKILKINEEKLKPLIQIYPSTDKNEAVIFWSEVTGIAKNNFSITVAVSRASQNKRPKNLLPHGTLNVRIHSRQKFFEIMGLIDGLVKHII